MNNDAPDRMYIDLDCPLGDLMPAYADEALTSIVANIFPLLMSFVPVKDVEPRPFNDDAIVGSGEGG